MMRILFLNLGSASLEAAHSALAGQDYEIFWSEPRALDLGTDDVIPFPFDAVEFSARIRTQFREGRPEEELKTMLKYAVQREHYADIALESLSGRTLSKRRYWLIPALFGLSTLTVLAAEFTVISTRSNRKASLQLRAEIARLNSGLEPQQDLLHRAEQARGSVETDSRSGSTTREPLKAQSEDLRKSCHRGWRRC